MSPGLFLQNVSDDNASTTPFDIHVEITKSIWNIYVSCHLLQFLKFCYQILHGSLLETVQ